MGRIGQVPWIPSPVVSARRKVGHCVASFAKATERKPHSAVVAGRKTSFIPISLQSLAAQGGGLGTARPTSTSAISAWVLSAAREIGPMGPIGPIFLGAAGASQGGLAQRPPQTPATALVPDKPNFLFQSACPFRARSIIRQFESVAQFIPGSSAGMGFQMPLNGGFEFDVAHDRLLVRQLTSLPATHRPCPAPGSSCRALPRW